MKNNISKIFESEIQSIEGKNCWSIVAGEGTGANIAIDIGKKILRQHPLKNKYLSDDQKRYTGEFSLFITCSWRLDSLDKIICGSKESNQNDGPIVTGLKNIINRKIMAIEIVKPAYDLYIIFEEHLSLKIFCDETNADDEFDNYSFFTQESIYTVSNRSDLVIENK